MSDLTERLQEIADSWTECIWCGCAEEYCCCTHPDTTSWRYSERGQVIADAASCIAQLTQQNAALQAERDRLRAALEWADAGKCPFCRNDEREGHTDDCEFKALKGTP